MHQLYKYSCFIFLLFASCVQDAKQGQNIQQTQENIDKTVDFNALANAYCSCSAELVALNKKAKHLAANPEQIGSPEEMADLLMQSEELQQKQVGCQQSLETQYQIRIHESPDALAAIQRSCPELAELMESAKKNED